MQRSQIETSANRAVKPHLTASSAFQLHHRSPDFAFQPRLGRTARFQRDFGSHGECRGIKRP
jgi:hypothetical protein